MARSWPSQRSKDAKRTVRQFVRPRYAGTLVRAPSGEIISCLPIVYAFIYAMNVAAKRKLASIRQHGNMSYAKESTMATPTKPPATNGRVRVGGVPRQSRPVRRAAAQSAAYSPPLTISRRDLIVDATDERFRNIIYQMVLGLQHLFSCREIFGRHLTLTGSQFAVLMGVAYRQKSDGVSIQDLAHHIRLAQPHVTTEVGRLLNKRLLVKKPNPRDQRSVLVSLSKRGQKAVDDVVPLVRSVNDFLFAGDLKR